MSFMIKDKHWWDKRLTTMKLNPQNQMNHTILDVYRRSKRLNIMDNFPLTEKICGLMDDFWWNKQLITMRVCPKHQMIIWYWMIIDNTNECSWWKFVQTILWTIWLWNCIDKANDWSRWMSFHRPRSLVWRWLIVDDTKDCSWWKFVQKPDEGFDPGWVSTEKNTDRNECLSINRKEKYHHVWLSMKQSTDQDKKTFKRTKWMIWFCMNIDETSDRS